MKRVLLILLLMCVPMLLLAQSNKRIKELEQQLEVMSQKAQFFEAVVNVLKNDYGVSVVKKRPGKSSRKGKSQR